MISHPFIDAFPKLPGRLLTALIPLVLVIGCTGIETTKQPDIFTGGDLEKLAGPVEVPYRPCRLGFVHTTRIEETDNATMAGKEITPPRAYTRVAYGSMEAAPVGGSLDWRLDVNRMDVNGNRVSHRQVPLSTGHFSTDSRGRKSRWRVHLPAYEDTGASRLFSPQRVAGLKTDTWELANDLVPYRYDRSEQTGDRLLKMAIGNLPELLKRMGVGDLPDDLVADLESVLLTADGWRQYKGRRVVIASAKRYLEFDSQNPRQHHRLKVEAAYMIDRMTSCPLNSILHLDMQTTYLSYTRNVRLNKAIDFQLLN